MNTIFTAADRNYALQAEVLLHSLVLSQKNPTHLIVFGDGWSRSEIDRLVALSSELVSVEVMEVDQEQFSDLRLSNGFPLATAYNILAPRYLLKNLDRALYLDADMVVLDDLNSLWQIELSSCVAAVVDAHVAVMGSPSMWRPWREEGRDPTAPYLNTGTLLIDIQQWNNQEITERALSHLRNYDLPCADQDALNLVLNGRFQLLPPRYNSMPYHLLSLFRYADLVDSQLDIESAIKNPAIVHFHRSFYGKPWTIGCSHPAKHIWREIATHVRPNWRKSIDVTGLLRNKAAKFAKMTKTDDLAEKMTAIEIDGRTR